MSTLKNLVTQYGDYKFSDVIESKGFPINVPLLEFVRFQIKYIVPIPLSNGELTLIAYIFLHGDHFVEQYIADGHSRSVKSVDNYISKLKRDGILLDGKKIHPDIYLTTDPTHFIHFFNITK